MFRLDNTSTGYCSFGSAFSSILSSSSSLSAREATYFHAPNHIFLPITSSVADPFFALRKMISLLAAFLHKSLNFVSMVTSESPSLQYAASSSCFRLNACSLVYTPLSLQTPSMYPMIPSIASAHTCATHSIVPSLWYCSSVPSGSCVMMVLISLFTNVFCTAIKEDSGVVCDSSFIYRSEPSLLFSSIWTSGPSRP